MLPGSYPIILSAAAQAFWFWIYAYVLIWMAFGFFALSFWRPQRRLTSFGYLLAFVACATLSIILGRAALSLPTL
jgi:hypothetical protein